MEGGRTIEFFLTGFGPFGSHKTNPTSILMNHIIDNIEEYQNEKYYNIVQCNIVTVAMEDCKEYYENLIKTVNEKRAANPLCDCIVIHFGLYSGIKCFNIEKHGYNCADFGIPDMKNNKCKNEKILDKYPLEHYFRTMLPIEYITKELKSAGFSAEISENPGRYICNFIYYLSMFYGYKHDIPSLFVHVPEFNDVSEEKQKYFVKSLLNTVASYIVLHK